MSHGIPQPPERRLLRLPQVIERVGLSRTHIYRMVEAGAFPKPCKPSPSVSCWDSVEIDAFIEGLRERRGEAA